MKQKVHLCSFLMILAIMLAITAHAQPVPVTQVPSDSRNFTSIGGLVYFTAENSLYRTDGTEEGTMLLANVMGHNFVEFQDEVYFIANGPRQTEELWKTDGTPAGTVPLGAYFNMFFVGQTDAYLFFAADLDETGLELYRTNGEAGSTILLKDIYPGPESGLSDNALYYSQINRQTEIPSAVLDNEVIFAADDGVNGIELWKTDGTPAGTIMIEDINPGAADGVASGRAIAFKGHVYFRGSDGVSGFELWRTDGSATGTSLFHDVVPGPNPSLLELVPPHDGNLYFSSQVPASGGDALDLWRTDGTSTVNIKRLCQDCRFDRFFVDYNNKLYFFLYQEYAVNVLWGTDGTPAGTVKLYEEFHDGEIPFFDAVGDYMIFYNTSQGHNLDLHRTQGEAPTPFWRFNSAGQLSTLISLAKVGDLLFFADHDGPADSYGVPNDPEDAFQLMQTDGVTVQSLRDIFGTSFRLTSNVTNYMDKLVFTTAAEGGLTLWIYDPQEVVATFTIVNADTDEDIKTLLEGEVFVKPEDLNINIRYNSVGDPARVVFKHQGRSVRSEREAPFALSGDYSGDYLVWEGATEGEHTIQATEYSNADEAGPSLTVTFTIQTGTACSAEGVISYEKWDGIQYNEVSRIPVNTEPDHVSTLSSFQAPSNQGHNYGARISGYICAPATGNYTFWISSNDHSELWLSTDDDPANKQRIAWLTRATDPEQWNKFSTQKSNQVWLEQGQRYYVEALHKQGIGTDHVAVGWQLPNGTLERPISGSRLSPFLSVEDAGARIAETTVLTKGDKLLEQISIYPNPATTGDRELIIAGYEGIDQDVETRVEIVNMTGEVIFADRVSCGGDCESYLLKVNEGLVPGIYLINLQTDNTRVSKRLLVK